MANGDIQRLADAVNRQVAAEAFWSQSGLNPRAILLRGNKNNSVSPSNLVNQFADPDGGLVALAHIELSGNTTTIGLAGTASVNEKTGLSATLFLDKNTQKYTLSIRSTEFAESIRDYLDVAADAKDIAGYGWAFGQIKSLEEFWNGLIAGTVGAPGANDGVKILDRDLLDGFRASMAAGSTMVDVTGYSLGANIAAAFTELHSAQVEHTYLFNGSGTGSVKRGTFSAVWQKFLQEFNAPSDPSGLAMPADQKEQLLAVYHAYLADPGRQYGDIYQDPRYKLALASIDGLVQGAVRDTTIFANTLSAPRIVDGFNSKILDAFSLDVARDGVLESGVSRSGIRHGSKTPIWHGPDDRSERVRYRGWDSGLRSCLR